MRAADAAGLLVERVRSRRWGLARVRRPSWGLAVAAIAGGETSIKIDVGVDPVDASTTFEWGSITKTITGVLTAYAIEAGELNASSTLSELLGISGAAAKITVAELATQCSGLPRLPPNLKASAIDQSDPYATYTAADLVAALESCELGAKAYLYSNFGFMTLGRVVSTVGDADYGQLARDRVLEPLGMFLASCPPPEQGRAPGYSGSHTVPWWTTPLPGAAGIGGPISDLALYLHAHLTPPAGTLGAAIAAAATIHSNTAPQMGYGWVHQGGGWWHNGGTGGFRSFAAFHRPTGTAVALLANSAQAEVVDSVGFAVLTEMVKTATP